jgi:hypothetical protein
MFAVSTFYFRVSHFCSLSIFSQEVEREIWFIVGCRNVVKHWVSIFEKKIWCASRALVNLPHIANRLTLTNFLFFCDAQPNFWTVRWSLNRNLYGRYPKDSKFQNSEYEVHQVGPKDYGSQNFTFLAFIGTELVSRQIFPTATARDRRNFFFRSNHVF